MNMEFDITPIVIILISIFGGLYITKIIISHQGSGSKYLKAKIKEMEEYADYQKKMIQHYKNKASNMEKPPAIEGNIDELGGILPDIVGQFADYLPRWAQPLLKDKESQKWILEYIEKNPDKAKEWFGRIVGKRKNEESADDLQAV